MGNQKLSRMKKKKTHNIGLGSACVCWGYIGFGVFQRLNKGD